MKIAIEILGVACMVIVIMTNTRIYAKFVQITKEVKPFSCEVCMCFWSYLIYSIIKNGITLETADMTILSAFICSVVGYYVSNKFLTLRA